MKPKIKTTCTKLQLQLLSFCLLCLSGKTRCDGNGPAVVTVEQDSDAVLPCSLSSKENIESYLFDWKKAAQIDGGQKEVFHYDAGIHYNNGQAGQSEEFKGRVSHFPEELKHGNASIIIRNTTVADSGDYTCSFPDLQPPQTFHIKLVVAKKPSITTLEETKDWSRLQCEVRGASPKPKVEWKDSSGNILPAEPQVTDRGGSYDIILQTTVTKTDYYHCVVTQEEINHQTEAKIHVYISEPVVVKVEEDGDALLPCSLSTKGNIEQGYFDWNKFVQHNERQKEVFQYLNGRHSNNGFGSQDEEFKGRVSHFQEELKDGNASIIIRNTKVADSGDYTCTLPVSRQTFHIKLVVDCVLKDRTDEKKPGTCPKPYLRILGPTKDGMLLQCEVQGASPIPKVELKDSSGNKLPAEEPQVTDRGGSYDIILQTTVTKTDNYSCVSTQEEICHQISAYTHVPVNEPVVVTVKQDQDALLPCSLSTKENIEQGYFDWNKLAQNNEKEKEVFRYLNGRHSNTGFGSQDDGFKGRVSHFQEELKHGNASIIIRNTRVTDSGDYTCTFTEPRKTFHIKLVVDCVLKDRTPEKKPGACPKPNLKILASTKDGMLLQCEVQGASPKPEVEWRDSSGKILPAEEPQVIERGGSYDIILQTTVTKTGNYSCVSTQEEVCHQISADTHVPVNGAASKPNIRTLDQTDNRALLQCEVNGNPQPEVEWRDSAGNKLPAQEPQVTVRDGRFYVTLNTIVTKTDRYRCVATQKDISHQIHDETSVHITGWIVAVLCTVSFILFVVAVGGVVLAVLVAKGRITLKYNKGSPADQKKCSYQGCGEASV